MTEEELQVIIEKIKARLATPEGQEVLRKAAEASAKRAKEIEEMTKIPWEWMHRPVDF